MMEKIFAIAIALLCIGGLSTEARAEGKILVAYFSWSGNAKALAGQIAEATGDVTAWLRKIGMTK